MCVCVCVCVCVCECECVPPPTKRRLSWFTKYPRTRQAARAHRMRAAGTGPRYSYCNRLIFFFFRALFSALFFPAIYYPPPPPAPPRRARKSETRHTPKFRFFCVLVSVRSAVRRVRRVWSPSLSLSPRPPPPLCPVACLSLSFFFFFFFFLSFFSSLFSSRDRSRREAPPRESVGGGRVGAEIARSSPRVRPGRRSRPTNCAA